MSDFIVLIHSDGDGNPVATGPHLHWVVVTDNPKPVAVNQLSDGGAFPHADCGEASVKSILNSRGIAAAVVTIEHDASAGSAGTSAAGLRSALCDFGVCGNETTNVYPAKNTPPFRTIMNPLFGRIETGQQAAYEKAYAGTTIVVANPAPKPAPVAPKPVAPVAPKPVAPVAPKPVAPVAPKPVAPVAPKPVAPVAPKPVAPVAPVTPVIPPVEPTPAPAAPILPPVEPVTPDVVPPVEPTPAPVAPQPAVTATPAPNPFAALLRFILALFGKR